MFNCLALTELVDEITASLDNNRYAMGLCIDVHLFYGSRGVALNRITSYLLN